MSSSRQASLHDIQVLPENTQGDDIIIGDIHGNLGLFDNLLKSLSNNDRLFVVGDLVDRGENSPGVIKTIIEHNKNKNKTPINIVRGNHESLTLNAITGLESIVDIMVDNPHITISEAITKLSLDNTDVSGHLANGGNWLLELFEDELYKGTIKIENGEIEYDDASEVKMIKDFMTSLPYILHVEGSKPFNMVHADMPFNDKELKFRIENKPFLTDEEKNYATWARTEREDKNPEDVYVKDTGRTRRSIPTYVGHNIVGMSDAPALRHETNTIDLDVGAYAYGAFLAANHTKGSCTWTGIHAPSDAYKVQSELVNKHMRLAHSKSFLSHAKHCATLPDLHALIHKYKFDKSFATLFKYAIRKQALNENLLMTALSDHSIIELFKSGLSPNYLFENGESLLHKAVRMQNYQLVCDLLDHGADPLIPSKHPNQVSLLALADQIGDQSIISKLEQYVIADAIAQNDMDLLIMCVEQGLDIFKVDIHGKNIYDLAKEASNLESVIALSINAISELSPLHIAAMKRDEHTFQNLLASRKSTDQPARVPKMVLDALFTNATRSQQVRLNFFYGRHGIDNGHVSITAAKIAEIHGLNKSTAKPSQSTERFFDHSKQEDKPKSKTKKISSDKTDQVKNQH